MSSKSPDFSTSIVGDLPHPDALRAIGELWVRLSQLEAWVDVAIGRLLDAGWSVTQPIVVNLGMKAKLDRAQPLLALRIQRLGDSDERRTLMEKLNTED
jgi:hypothetical protein